VKEIPVTNADINSHAETGDQPSRLEQLLPGDVIDFADITELAAFEDGLADVVQPKHDPVLWAARRELRDLIRPPKFNGTIANVYLTVMANPYERLLDADMRGWTGGPKMVLGKSHELSSQAADLHASRYIGFILTANAKSSGRGIIGQIQAEMWYFPIPPTIASAGKNYRTQNRLSNNYGETIRRIVTKPRYEMGLFLAHDASSRKIGFDKLRHAMAGPILTPMRD
jgi:hypothetical protein